MNIKITKQTDSQFHEDEKRPAKLILTVKKGSQPHYFLIIINHPNRNPEGQLPVLYEQEHLADSFDHALSIGKHLINNDFSYVETTFEEIKYIPSGKRGKMKLDKKEPDVVLPPLTAVATVAPMTSKADVIVVESQVVKSLPKNKEKPVKLLKKETKVKVKTKTKKVEPKKTVKKVKTAKKVEPKKKTVKKVKKNTKTLKQKK